ncbi:MAG: histone deacetylase family protein [Spirochaetales bacterium]|nr:histone deacetylase family protein [Spirochaetales bacterium]
MIRIRRVYSSALPSDRDQIAQVRELFRRNFAAVAEYAEKIQDMLDRPFHYGYRTILLVSLSANHRVSGFSLVLHFPEINSSLLDFIATDPAIKGGGLGSALYEATRETAQQLGSKGMYMEALPDDPGVVKDPAVLRENRRRLKFYEYYAVYPIVGTAYETPVGDSPAPVLLFDGLGRRQPLGRAECRAAVRLILERKYSHLVGPEYIRRVVASIVEDPVRFREPRYVKTEPHPQIMDGRLIRSMALVSSTVHRIHHVRERGYVERPARVEVLREVLLATRHFDAVEPRPHGGRFLREVHDPDFVQYLKTVCEQLAPSRPVYPYVFPVRRPERKPQELAVRAGYYCIDTFTPLDQNAYRAARAAVDVALSAADEVLEGRPVAYAVCRPPGHHAGRRVFGGFCYFNNAAVAAQRISQEGRVAILDIDFHHGNGTQDIFWNRADVLTVSIHGHPNFAYPYFSGFADEVGEGFGRGTNRNFPLPENAGEERYLQTLERALELVERFKPLVLVVCLGYDTMAGDPTGSFGLRAQSLEAIGRRLAAPGRPLLVVQEGGYSLRNLRRGSAALFRGVTGELLAKDRKKPPRPPAGGEENWKRPQDKGTFLVDRNSARRPSP